MLTMIIVCPLVAIILCLLVPGDKPRLVKIVSLLPAVVSLGLALLVWAAYDTGVGGFQLGESYDWIPRFGIKYSVAVDGIAVVLVTLNAIVYVTGVLSMWSLQVRVKEYFAFMHVLVLGVYGVFMSLDLFAFFFFYEVAVLPMYLLIAVWGSTRKEYSAMKLTLYLMAGSALLFPALVSLYYEAGLGSWNILELASVEYSSTFQYIVYPFLYLGFGILAGMFPFHGWSPTGHVAAPTAVSMLHAGVLMKLGAFGILRVAITILPQGAADWAFVFGALATVNIVYGAFVAMRQTDFKYVIGFSSVSHMGIVLLGLNTLTVDGVNGAVFQMFAHGVMTALFFSAVGFIYDQTHDRDIRNFGGLVSQIPIAVTFFILAGLCGIGVPGFASFWAEVLVFIAAIRVFPVMGVLAVVGLIFTALYMLRVYAKAFFGPANDNWQHLKEPTPWEMIPRVTLLAVLLVFGFFPSWILDVINSATAAIPGVIP